MENAVCQGSIYLYVGYRSVLPKGYHSETRIKIKSQNPMHPLYLFEFCKSKIVLKFCIEHGDITGRNFKSIGQLEINYEQKRFRESSWRWISEKYPIVLRPHPVIVWLIGTYDWPHIWSLNDLSYDADYNIKNQPNKLQYNIH